MTAPLVSVIVPVYNGEPFLAEALESVFAQDHRPLEVIVIDDGSTDGSAEVARSFEDVVVLRQDNAGPGAARNAGLAVARGSFITFLDADDRMTPGRLSTQVEHLRTHPDVGCVLLRQELALEPGVAEPPWARFSPAAGELAGALMMTAMVRREVVELVGGFDPSFRMCEDADWLFRFRENGVVIDMLPFVGVIRRVHRDNLSHQNEGFKLEMAKAVRGKLERARVHEAQGT